MHVALGVLVHRTWVVRVTVDLPSPLSPAAAFINSHWVRRCHGAAELQEHQCRNSNRFHTLEILTLSDKRHDREARVLQLVSK